MDLSGQTLIKMSWVVDQDTGLTTITYSDESDVVLGDIVIESVKLRSFLEGSSDIAHALFPSTLDATTRVKQRTVFSQETGQGEMVFE